MAEAERPYKGTSDAELIRAFSARKASGGDLEPVAAELRIRGRFAAIGEAPPVGWTPASASALQKAGEASSNSGMAAFGGLLFLVGLYFLFDPTRTSGDTVVNLQALTLGETFTISGSIFLAAALRRR